MIGLGGGGNGKDCVLDAAFSSLNGDVGLTGTGNIFLVLIGILVISPPVPNPLAPKLEVVGVIAN